MDNRQSTLTTLAAQQDWWHGLSESWKKAFNETMLNRGPITDMPDEKGFGWILESPSFRFAGPKAFHPNMTFELTDLSGLSVMAQATVICVTNHQIADLQPIASLTGVTSLFLNDNALESLEGIEGMSDLKMLYVTGNKISSLKPLEYLTKLTSVQCGVNRLSSFEGLHEANTKFLENFVGLPNRVAQTEIDRLQNDLRVRVMK